MKITDIHRKLQVKYMHIHNNNNNSIYFRNNLVRKKQS